MEHLTEVFTWKLMKTNIKLRTQTHTCCICALMRRSSCPQRHSISRPTCSGLSWTGIRGLFTCNSTDHTNHPFKKKNTQARRDTTNAHMLPILQVSKKGCLMRVEGEWSARRQETEPAGRTHPRWIWIATKRLPPPDLKAWCWDLPLNASW